MTQINCPIILIGTNRSGTTWLFRVFSQHPDLASWVEPKYVWEWGNNYKPNDILTADDAKPKIINHIRERFARFVQEEGKKRLFEKTPTNSLRLSFVHKVYPEAKIIHIVRDGRGVFVSSSTIKNKEFYRPSLLKSRTWEMIQETPILGIPAYFPQIIDTLSAKMGKKPLQYWGPRPQGWKESLKNDSSNVLLAKQWAQLTSRALDDSQDISPESYQRFRYEDLVENPRDYFAKMVDFVELEKPEIIIDEAVKTANPTKYDRWQNLIPASVLSEIRPYMEPTLNRLGYQW